MKTKTSSKPMPERSGFTPAELGNRAGRAEIKTYRATMNGKPINVTIPENEPNNEEMLMDATGEALEIIRAQDTLPAWAQDVISVLINARSEVKWNRIPVSAFASALKNQ